MTAITDPHLALLSFQKALISGTIKPKRCKVRRELYYLRDKPTPDDIRMTYAMVVGRQVKALAIYMENERYEGQRCFGIGYAVAVPYRGQGLAKAVVESSLEEFAMMLRKDSVELGFFVEAIVDVNNAVSNRVAEQLFGVPTPTRESESGLPAFHYIKRMS
jgi:RimJ/RimL family protein N-acetyltransferase